MRTGVDRQFPGHMLMQIGFGERRFRGLYKCHNLEFSRSGNHHGNSLRDAG